MITIAIKIVINLHKAPVIACSKTFLEGSSTQGGTAVLFEMGGFPVLKLRKTKKTTIKLRHAQKSGQA